MPEYSADRVKLTAIPQPVRQGAWWVHSWTITVPRGGVIGDFKFPAPYVDTEGAICVLLYAVRDTFVLKISEKDKVISPGALVFASQIVNAMRAAFGPDVLVDGDRENPLFLIVRR